MRKLLGFTCVFALVIVSASYASMGAGKPSTPQPPPSMPSSMQGDEEEGPSAARQEAERYYSDGYNMVAKARQDIADGKTKNVDKKFKKALEKGERAVEIDSTYHEAWNLIGYCARQLKDYDRSLAAYGKCLALKPDYAAAREYLGEAYVELGDVAKAREQLAWLEKAQATEEIGRLKPSIEAWEKAHPSAATASAPQAAAPANSGSDADPPAAPADTTSAPH